MSVGIRLHDVAPGTLEERVQRAKAQGFECVHLALSKVISPALMEPAAATCGLADYVRRAMNGLDIAVLGCYLQLAQEDDAAYRKIADKYIAHLRMAGWMGAGVVGTETPANNVSLEERHSERMFRLFMDRLYPVVEAAEKLGQILAVEPVFTHIVSDARKARRMLDEIHSPNLRIILDPVNLLHESNLDRRDAVLAEAVELLGEETQILHLKDYVLENGKIRSCAPGIGLMDYESFMPYIRQHKPWLHVTLEDTTPADAEASGVFTRKLVLGQF